ncbi:MAG: dihydrodipicolinate synthase family protein [Abditibacteriales bacterium]|nr:dihydrodipicolinate synthase family protein [Abditibacteriales bacterium]
MSATWRGIFTIPQTPFDEQGQLDETSLRREIDFCLACGAHGIVMPVLASEFFVLTDDERQRITDIVIEQVDHRVPVVIGTAGVSKEHAVALSRYANARGADAVIAMPPYIVKAPTAGVFAYYQAISDTIDIPIFIQNATPPLGSSLSPSVLNQLVSDLEHVEYLKEEVTPAGHQITALLALNNPKLKGVFGGAGGRFMLSELERGACGFMPACGLTDVYVSIWEAWTQGNQDRARCLFNVLLPVLNLETVFGVALVKEILRRRGVIASATVRKPDALALDDFDLRELERTLEEIKPFWRV